ncbi:MAG TPA: ATP-binding protein [Armatimonadota bacterium]|jgi:PAS domain S-box-containing protein
MRVTDQVNPVYSRLNELLDGVPGFVWEYKGCPGAPGGHLAYVSPGVRDIFGDTRFTPASALSRIIASVHPADVLLVRSKIIEVFHSGQKGGVRIRCLRGDGAIVWLDVRMAAVVDVTRRSVGLHGMAVDVTEQRRIEDALRQRENEFRNLAENAPDEIVRFDRDARHIYANPAVCEGARMTREAIIGKTHTELGLPSGHAEEWESWVRQVLASGLERVETFEPLAGRGRKCLHARIIPERNESGEIESVLAIVRDISDQHRAKEIEAFLARAGERLSATLDYEGTLETVTDLAVPLIADICAVDLIDADGIVRRVAEHGIDPEAAARARELAGEAPFDAEAEINVPLTVRTGETLLVSDVNDEWLESVSAGRRLTLVLKTLGIRSLLTTPLSARGKLIGSMTFAMTTSGRRLSQVDVVLAEVFSNRCGQAIDNASLFRQVEQLNRHKDEFIAMLGHELRNPLAAISNAVSAVQSRYTLADGPFRDTQAEIMRQIGLMARLVDDLLDATRITHGQIHLRRERMDAGEAVLLAVSSLEGQAAAKGQRVDLDIPESGLPISADPVRIQQICTNLLQNAIRYTPPGGRIRVVADRTGNSITLRFADDGQGMDADLVPHVFDLLVQGTPNLDRKEAGLGIGLTLVKRLVEMHGGSVEAHSDGPGKGSVFVVSLPVDAEVGASYPGMPLAKTSASRRLSSILVVDDNAFAARMMAEVLRSLGHQVQVAGDGEAAIELAVQSTPDVALMDIGLPGMDGYEVARRLRAEPSCRDMRLIALTGYGGQDDRQRSMAAGFDEHLVKPLDFDVLDSLLASIPEGRGR